MFSTNVYYCLISNEHCFTFVNRSIMYLLLMKLELFISVYYFIDDVCMCMQMMYVLSMENVSFELKIKSQSSSVKKCFNYP